MYPAPFDYRRPATIEDAIVALAQDGTRVLAGGHSLLPALKARSTEAATLVDVTELDALVGIDRDDAAEETVIGAATAYADVLADGTLAAYAPEVEAAVAAVGDPQIRNRGTIGGNIVQADPGADVPAAVLAADGSVVVAGADGERTIAVDDLYPAPGDRDTDAPDPAAALSPDELVTAVRIPDGDGTGWAYARKTHQATGYATVGVAARVGTTGGEIASARVAATGIADVPVRLTAVEDAIVGQDGDRAADLAAEHATADLDPSTARSDPNVSGAYRLQALERYTERVVGTAIDRAATPESGDRR